MSPGARKNARPSLQGPGISSGRGNRIIRFEKRKGGPASAIERHHERKKPRYAGNPDVGAENIFSAVVHMDERNPQCTRASYR